MGRAIIAEEEVCDWSNVDCKDGGSADSFMLETDSAICAAVDLIPLLLVIAALEDCGGVFTEG